MCRPRCFQHCQKQLQHQPRASAVEFVHIRTVSQNGYGCLQMSSLSCSHRSRFLRHVHIPGWSLPDGWRPGATGLGPDGPSLSLGPDPTQIALFPFPCQPRFWGRGVVLDLGRKERDSKAREASVWEWLGALASCPLGPSWGRLGPSCSPLGPSWGHLGFGLRCGLHVLSHRKINRNQWSVWPPSTLCFNISHGEANIDSTASPIRVSSGRPLPRSM